MIGQPREPRVNSQKAGEVQMQYWWLVTADYSRERRSCAPIQIGGVFQHLERNVGQIEKAANVFRRLFKKA